MPLPPPSSEFSLLPGSVLLVNHLGLPAIPYTHPPRAWGDRKALSVLRTSYDHSKIYNSSKFNYYGLLYNDKYRKKNRRGRKQT